MFAISHVNDCNLILYPGPPDELLFSLNGIAVGYVYLRFYQVRTVSVLLPSSNGVSLVYLRF